MLVGEGGEPVDHDAESGQPDLDDGALHRECVGGRVDVLARAREVGQFGDLLESELAEPVANEVLDGLHVVAGH